ncbi:MAG: hypothetical protein KY468_13570 [Armatimonadetes bacterium]|nr:hypothetical protein [Armatimonadota bacterium]
MDETPSRRISFPESVLLRPKMYTIGGTFEEVMAFLEGFYSGLAKADPHNLSVVEWGIFKTEWLRRKLYNEYGLELSGSPVFDQIKNHWNDDEILKKKTKEWLTEFIESGFVKKSLQDSLHSFPDNSRSKMYFEELLRELRELDDLGHPTSL